MAASAVVASMWAPITLAVETAVLDIKRMTLEQLMDIDVYSASRRPEPVQSVPSAIYVLTADDIRRAHATSIPEALRLVPGVQVARVDANKWAVSIRGFNSRAAQNLLVLIDGRSIYDPLFSGVLWESRDVMLEDVERIEVIRGPGGTLWGANAVNGVINVITKHARDTQGGLLAAGAGTEDRVFGGVRYGWQPGDKQYARVYTKSYDRGSGFSPTANAHDQTQMNQTGFRWDWQADARNTVRVSGDLFSTEAGQRDNATAIQDVDHRGGNLLAHWVRQLSSNENWRVQFYYDRIDLDLVGLTEKRDTYDLEFQHTIVPASAHQVVWGLGYRDTRDDVNSVAIAPRRRQDQTASAFVQDTIALTPDKLQLTLGTKVENNDYSGTEWQPNARVAWTPAAGSVYWAAASRAVRVPSRLEADLLNPGTGARRGDNFQSEYVYAYEAGHRRLVTANFWYDAALFYNVYRHLRTIEPPPVGPLENRMEGRTYGLELAGRWQITPAWRFDSTYTYLKMDLELDATSSNVTLPATTEGSNPQHQLALRSAYDMGRDLQFDATLRFVDDLPVLSVPAYTALDLGLTWFVRRDVELSLVGQNLLDSHHPEQALVPNGLGTEVVRSIYTKLIWRF